MALRTHEGERVGATSSPLSAPVRLVGIQSLRGFAVLLVIMVHLHHTERKYSHGPILLGAWNPIGISGVDIFLVVSGFVLTYLAFGHIGQASYARAYAYARVTRVYPIYVLVTALLIPVYVSQPTLINAAEGHQVNLWRSLLLIPDVRLPLIPVAWTLHHEVYFYLVFGLMLWLPERHLPKLMLLWLMVTAALIGWGQQVPRPQQGAFERVLFNAINLDFILGMTAAYAVAHGPRRGATACLWGALLWVAVAYSIWLAATGDYWVSDGWRVAVFGLPATLFIYAIVVRELDQGRVFWPKLAWIGDCAYSVYLIHLIVLVVMGRLWERFGVPGMPAHLVFLALSLGIALGLGNAIYRHVERPILQWARRHDPTRTHAAPKSVVT